MAICIEEFIQALILILNGHPKQFDIVFSIFVKWAKSYLQDGRKVRPC